jgi:hypothetical protein
MPPEEPGMPGIPPEELVEPGKPGNPPVGQGTLAPLTETFTSMSPSPSASMPTSPLSLPAVEPGMGEPSVGMELRSPRLPSLSPEEDEDEPEEDWEPERVDPGRLAVAPGKPGEPLAPGSEGVDEPLAPGEPELGELEPELDEDDELLLGMEGALEPEEPEGLELEAVGIPEEELLLDELCFSSQAVNINPSVVATTNARNGLRCVMLIHPPNPLKADRYRVLSGVQGQHPPQIRKAQQNSHHLCFDNLNPHLNRPVYSLRVASGVCSLSRNAPAAGIPAARVPPWDMLISCLRTDIVDGRQPVIEEKVSSSGGAGPLPRSIGLPCLNCQK